MVTSGEVIAERFEVGDPIGSGGMGTVFAGYDRMSGRSVALKVMVSRGASAAERFVREAAALAALKHPAIVRHVAHGATPDGQPYLVMERLQGESLSDRLERATLSVDESLALTRRVLEALRAAHEAGVVHRDIKPSNLFLVDGDPRQPKVLDFGVARQSGARQALTRTGAVVGTIGYLAPEQARDGRSVDRRADIFALGCVLFECLSGVRAFAGGHPVAVLARLLAADVPRLADVRPDLPAALDALVGRMMAKEPDQRFSDAGSVLEALADLGDVQGEGPDVRFSPAPLTGDEQRIVNAILMDRSDAGREDETLSLEAHETTRAEVLKVVERFGGEVTPLGFGKVMVLFREGTGAATDRARVAAECALALVEAFPEARVALATGRAGTAAGVALGPGIDSAASLLSSVGPGEVFVGEVTRALLDERFEVEGQRLRASRSERAGAVRALLGRPSICVGRRKELRLLTDTFEECVEDEAAQAVLLVAPAGVGKSRLRHELVARLRSAADGRPKPTVLEARAHAMGAGSTAMALRGLVRDAFDVGVLPRDGTLPEYLARLGVAEPTRSAELLTELGGLPTGAPSPELRGARSDARVMAEWCERVVSEWLAAEARVRPTLVVVEDLHWGDGLSVRVLGRALQEAAEAPLMVLATARPEVDDHFPQLWSAARPQRLALRGLSRRASVQLARAHLPDAAEEAVAEIAERAAGNAFFLEELVRHAAEGRGEPPESVLAMVEARIAAIDPAARRVLQAASVFGIELPEAGVHAMLERSTAPHDIASWIDHLVDLELLVYHPVRAGALAFRHALVRDAAYAMIGPTARAAAHLAAAEWLTLHDGDPLALIEHFERAGEPERAVPSYLAAARAAAGSHETERAKRLSERGLAAGARGIERGQLHLVGGYAFAWAERFDEASERFASAIEELPPGSSDWYHATGGKVFCEVSLGRPERAMKELFASVSVDQLPDAGGLTGHAACVVAQAMILSGNRPMGAKMLERMDRAAEAHEPEPAFEGWRALTHWYFAMFFEDDLVAGERAAQACEARFADAGGSHAMEMSKIYRGATLYELGDLRGAVELLEQARGSNVGLVRSVGALLGVVPLVDAERWAAVAEDAACLETAAGKRWFEAVGRAARCWARRAAGDTEGAVQEGLRAVEAAAGRSANSGALAGAALCDALLAAGRAAEAREHLERIQQRLPKDPPMLPSIRARFELARAQALAATGDVTEAQAIADRMHQALLELAATLPEERRADFLALPVHRAIREITR